MTSASLHVYESADEASQRYAARMIYLTEEEELSAFGGTALEPMGRTLKPPGLFMSRRQARADSTLSAQRANKDIGTDPLRSVRAQAMEKKPLVPRRTDAAIRGKQKSDSKRSAAVEDNPENRPEHWRRVKEAGVTFWFNDFTGVATDECPHECLQVILAREREARECARGKLKISGVEKVPERGGGLEIDHEEGTGALVYDSAEFEQAMKILDGAAAAADKRVSLVNAVG